MEYKIISGRVEEIRRAVMEPRQYGQVKRRGVRVRGRSSLRKIMLNEIESVKRLARDINCNFGPGDLWLVLRYSDERLPADRGEAEKVISALLRKLRDKYRRETGEKLRYILTTSDKSPRRGELARLHHHVVMDRLAYEYLATLWPADELSYVIMDGRLDYTGIARYMVQNGRASGKRAWSASKGLKKPVYTEPVPVSEDDDIRRRIPRGAEIRERKELQDEETGFMSSYVRYIRPKAEAKRGGRSVRRE